MKKLLVVLFSTLMVLLMCCAGAEEADEPTVYTSGDWEYVLLEDGTAEIADYNGEAVALTIPAEIDGYAVTGIGNEAFSFNEFLTSVTIPDSVTSVGVNPFLVCFKLMDIIVSPDHPTLATIDGVLFDKTEKKLICYPYAYTNSSYVIPQGIRVIGAFAFYGCPSLTSITIPDSVTTIRGNPFTLCKKLMDIIVSPDQPALATIDGVLFDKTEKMLICYPLAYTNSSYAIPQGIRSIGAYAFSWCESLTSVTIPDSVTAIEYCAFYNCASLTSVTIPDSVTTIADFAFYYCTSLTSVAIPDSVTAIGYCVFGCCPLTSVTIPESVTSIGDWAFCYCTSLTSVAIPNAVVSIGDWAFYGCRSLTSVTIPDSVTAIGDEAFNDCGSMTFTVPRDSFAAQWCKDNNLRYTYPDSLDWLND